MRFLARYYLGVIMSVPFHSNHTKGHFGCNGRAALFAWPGADTVTTIFLVHPSGALYRLLRISLWKKSLGPCNRLGERRLRRRRVHHGQLQIVRARPQLGLPHLHKLVADLGVHAAAGEGEGEEELGRSLVCPTCTNLSVIADPRESMSGGGGSRGGRG